MAGQKTKKPKPSAAEKQEQLNRELDAGLYHGKLEDMRALIEKGATVDHFVDEWLDEEEDEEKRKRRKIIGHIAPIHKSAQARRPDLVALFIENGADVNNPKFNGSGPLHYAAASGKPEAGLLMLEQGADPNHVDFEGTTPLMDCIRSGNKELFYALLPLTENLDQQENKAPWHNRHEKPEYTGDTAVLRAAGRGWSDEVKALHEHGADLTIAGNYQRNILHITASRKYHDITAYVLEHAPELADQPEYRGGLPLHKAFMMRSEENIKLLLPVTTNLEAVEIAEHPGKGDARGNTLLLTAADSTGNVEWVKTLHEKGADITASGLTGKNALHYAARHKDPALATYLLEHAPELLNAQDDDGNTPLHIAIQSNHNAVVNALLKSKPDLSITNKAGYAPFLFAAFSNNAHAVKKLAKKIPDINERDTRGRNAIHICAERGNGRALAAYAAMGVDAGALDDAGNAPLLLSAGAEKPEALSALIKLGVDLKATNTDGFSAMHMAVSFNRDKNVAILAEHGVSLYEPLADGDRPIDMAREGQQQTHFKTIFNFVRSEQTKQISSQMRRRKRKSPKVPGLK